MRFENRTVIVTGGSKGIGAGCVNVFAAEGGNVALFDIDLERGEQIAARLTASGPGRVKVFPCDVYRRRLFSRIARR